MSRADALRVPAAPRLPGALRAAVVDFYFHSWRLVPANAVWGAGLLALIVLAGIWLPAVALVVLLAVPLAGIFRMAALIVRGEDVVLSDAFRAYRSYLTTSLVAGFAIVLAAAVFTFNTAVGFTSANPILWAIATMAAWGLLALWVGVWIFWPLLVDPRREELSLRGRMRLTGLLLLAFPLRFAALAAVIAIVVAVSTVAFAALLTVSVAYSALLAARYVLPAADRLEGRATEPVPE